MTMPYDLKHGKMIRSFYFSKKLHNLLEEYAIHWETSRNNALTRILQELERHLELGDLPESSPLILPKRKRKPKKEGK